MTLVTVGLMVLVMVMVTVLVMVMVTVMEMLQELGGVSVRKLILGIFLLSNYSLFASDGWDEYIVDQCKVVGVQVDLVKAILMQENPKLDPAAQHVNKNGSVDLGLFQLNSNYLYSDFIPRYWHFGEEFVWSDPYHSIYLGVRIIKELHQLFWREPTKKSRLFAVALAYNCGYWAVMTGKVPESSVVYAVSVLEALE